MRNRNGKSLIERSEAKSYDGRDIEFFSSRLEFEIKAAAVVEGGKSKMMFEGYASIFNTPDSYKDIILPGAFKNTIKQKGPSLDKTSGRIASDIKSLWQHNPDWPFGLPQEIREDSTGLYHATLITETNENRDRVEYMADGVVSGQSIGFVTVKADMDEEDEDDFWPTRYIKEIDLWEFSPVTFPAHSDAVTTMVQKSRGLLRAVKSHAKGGQDGFGGTLELAQKMRGITVPAVEEAITILQSIKEAVEEESNAEGQEPHDEVVVDDVDTSAEDPEFIKALEEFDFELRARSLDRKIGRNQ